MCHSLSTQLSAYLIKKIFQTITNRDVIKSVDRKTKNAFNVVESDLEHSHLYVFYKIEAIVIFDTRIYIRLLSKELL